MNISYRASSLQALAESRERWRALVRLGADFAFETDAQGCFSLLSPDPALGWSAKELIGTRADALLFGAGAASAGAVLSPFRPTTLRARRRVWLRDADGAACDLLFSIAPIDGRAGCLRGLGFDLTGVDGLDAPRAATLLRLETTRLIVRRMRGVALPFASLSVALGELLSALGARGVVLVLHDPEAPLRVAAKAGAGWPGPMQALHDAVLEICAEPPIWLQESMLQQAICGQSLLLCGSTNHFTDRAVLAVWRDAAPWTDEEAALAASLLPAIQPVLEHEQIQRETARQSRTDILTGLLNRQGFTAELVRRFERLDREGLQAALMVIGLDGLGLINAGSGLASGDALLRAAAISLRDGVRPTDLVARLGGDLFGLWLDGADQFAAAERADQLVRAGILSEDATGGRLQISIGLAVRPGRSFESVDSLLHRAWSVMRAIKLEGGGRWRVSNAEPTP